MPKEKPMSPAPHEPPPKEPHDRREKPKRRRRRFPFLLFLILLLVIVIALLIYFKPFGGNGFGVGGNGGESGSQSGSAVESVPESDSSSSSESTVAVIRIDGTDIYFDGEKCENVSALEDKITSVGTNKSYEIDHSTAIKSTYDEVKQKLSELEDALDIKVNYNE